MAAGTAGVRFFATEFSRMIAPAAACPLPVEPVVSQLVDLQLIDLQSAHLSVVPRREDECIDC